MSFLYHQEEISTHISWWIFLFLFPRVIVALSMSQIPYSLTYPPDEPRGSRCNKCVNTIPLLLKYFCGKRKHSCITLEEIQAWGKSYRSLRKERRADSSSNSVKNCYHSAHQSQRGTLENHCQEVASADPPNQVLPQWDRRCNKEQNRPTEVILLAVKLSFMWGRLHTSVTFRLIKIQFLPWTPPEGQKTFPQQNKR